MERVPAIKDETSQQPIASAWRPALVRLVASIARDDFSPERLPPTVDRIRPDVVAQIRDYVREFGETLAELPDACWESSVSQWTVARVSLGGPSGWEAGPRWRSVADRAYR